MIDAHRIRDLFFSLTAISSPSFHEAEMAEHITKMLAPLGFAVTRDGAGAAIGGETGNIYAFREGELPGPPLMFCAHMDTVSPCAGKRVTLDECGVFRAAGDTVLGSDDAAGICEIFEALESIREDGEPCRSLELVFTVAEEYFLKGAESFDLSLLKSREGYVLDSDEEIGTAVIGAPTGIRLVANVKGESAHAALSPEKGVNAILAAARGIAKMRLGRVDGETTANIGIIRGGESGNIVPGECFVEGEARSLSREKADAQIEHMCRCLKSAAEETGASCDIQLTRVYEAYSIDPQEPVVGRFERACREAGLETRLTSSCGGSDNSVLTRCGIKSIVLACGMHAVHGTGEWTTLDELVKMAQVTQMLMTSPD